MAICDENIEKNCDECYEVGRADTDLTFIYGLTPTTQYYLWVVDSLNKNFKVLFTSGADGSFTIDPSDSAYPGGMFNIFAGEFEVFISSDASGETIVPLTIYATPYNCVLLTITESANTSCSPSVPGCDPAYITDSNGVTIFEVASGESGTCTPTEQCVDVTVENSDETYSQQVASGGTLVVPDSTISNEDDSYVQSLPATIDLELPLETIQITDENDVVLETILNSPYKDLVIEIQQPVGIRYQRDYRTGELDIYLKYSDGWQAENGGYDATNPVFPLTIAELDYTDATGWTLMGNNAFGNKERFTDEAGVRSTDTNVLFFIDHLTGLMHYATTSGTYQDIYNNWFGAGNKLEGINTATLNGYGDWFCANTKIINNLIDYSGTGSNLWMCPYLRTIALNYGSSTSWNASFHYNLSSSVGQYYNYTKAVTNAKQLLIRIYYK